MSDQPRGLMQLMREGSGVRVYDPAQKFDYADIQSVIDSMDKTYRDRPFMLSVSKSFMEGWEIMNSGDPVRIAKYQEECRISLERHMVEATKKFIAKYGEDSFRFIDRIKREVVRYPSEYWINTANIDYIDIASWSTTTPDDEYHEYNDDIFCVSWRKGVFVFYVSYAGGYAGSKVIRTDLTMSEVEEFIKHQPRPSI